VVDGVEANNETVFIEKAEQYLSDELRSETMTLAQLFEKKGMEKGLEQGLQEGRQEVALRMLKEGLGMDLITKLTGLSEENIVKLQEHVD